ncbi:hypothetical protein [Chromobacterium amazonense]|uniref:Uncharacterized protein n=1 Tax=Chromobacterium amazonense TaxID=1382803 RepID=A0ABU8UY95_9NEIS|nr:hypothetical protein [Chromobacterium amazonense]MDQ4540976.1 hypothetical protein [Chromobacterium amazonense]
MKTSHVLLSNPSGKPRLFDSALCAQAGREMPVNRLAWADFSASQQTTMVLVLFEDAGWIRTGQIERARAIE